MSPLICHLVMVVLHGLVHMAVSADDETGKNNNTTDAPYVSITLLLLLLLLSPLQSFFIFIV